MSHDEHVGAVDAAKNQYSALMGELHAVKETAEQCLNAIYSAVGQDGGPDIAGDIRSDGLAIPENIEQIIGQAASIIENLDAYADPWR